MGTARCRQKLTQRGRPVARRYDKRAVPERALKRGRCRSPYGQKRRVPEVDTEGSLIRRHWLCKPPGVG